MVLPIVFGLLVMMYVPALADDDVNPGGGYSGSGDWTGTASDDTYTNEAAGVVDAGDIDMSQGGSDTVINYGSVTANGGGTAGGGILGSADGGNRIENYGTVEFNILGSQITTDNMVSAGNTIINDGKAGQLCGSDAQGDGNTIGYNTIYNSGVASAIFADAANGENTVGGWNYIENSGVYLVTSLVRIIEVLDLQGGIYL